MTISFPSTAVNNDVSFFLDFEGMLTRDQSTVYREDLLVFRDKTDNTAISVADNGGGFLQAINSNGLYTGNKGYLSTTYNSALQLGTNPYTIEFIFLTPGFRASITESILSVGATAASNNWEIGIDNLGRPFFIYGTTTETATSATITDDIFQHIAIVRTGTGSNETKMYLNGVAIRTFTDATDYNYTDGLYIGSGRDGSGSTQIYFKNIRISTVAQYTEDFTAPNSFSYVAVGDTYSYLDKTYKWNGVKWFDRSKYNANLPGEYRNYAAVSGSANTTTLDLRSANFFEIDLVAGIDTEVIFENEALSQNLLIKLNQDDLSIPYSLETASYDNVEASIGAFNAASSFTWSDDGRYLYIPQTDARYLARATPLSGIPWDVESGFGYNETGTFASYNWVALDLSPNGQYFAASRTYQYASYISLPTLYSIASMSFSTIPGVPVSYGVSFVKNGNAALYLGFDSIIREYAMTTPYNTYTTLTTLVDSFDLGFADGSVSGLRLNGDESKIYVVHDGKVKSYNLNQNSTIGSLDLSSEYIYDPGVAATHLDIKTDGTKMYITVNSTSRVIRQYDMLNELDKPTISWPSNVTWSTGTPPSITGTTLIEFYKYNGTWHGNVITENL